MSFKKRSRPVAQTRRKDDSDSGEEDTAGVVKTEVRQISGSNVQTTHKGGKSSEITGTTVYESAREIVAHKYAGDATHTSEIDTEIDRDARAILERNIKLNSEGATDGEKVYRGQAGYKNFIPKDMAQVGSNKYTGTQGPIRAPSFVRSTARFDYQPDICKDYKETGFCGYGDNCKFLHDRGDYKSGWQLEKEWDEIQAKKKKRLEESLKGFGEDGEEGDGGQERGGGAVEEEDDNEYAINLSDEEGDGAGGPVDTDGLPFACFICRERFTDPVVTMCKHYFCGQCAKDFSRSNKTTNCAACGKNTAGVFNKADKLARKIAKITKSS